MTRTILACVLGTLLVGVPPVARGAVAQERSARRDRDAGPTLPRDVARDVVDLYNAPGTERTAGALDIARDRDVTGDVAVLGGPLTVAGRVRGRLLAVNADVTFRPGARVDGDVIVVGGIVDGRQDATLGGELRIYRQPLAYRLEGGRLAVDPGAEGDAPRPWWRRRDREGRTYTTVTLATAKTYNRVEGLPIQFGPSLRHDFGPAQVRVEARGIFRTAGEFMWDSANVGHTARAEVRLGRGRGVRVGGRLYDEVEAVEDWQLGDGEAGLAAFFAHRDYRDYYNRHGGTAYLAFHASPDAHLTLSLSDQRWASRSVRDPFTLFRNGAPWRPNPSLDEGRFHLANATLRFDTRNDTQNPWSGWYLVVDYERGTGAAERLGPMAGSAGVLDPAIVERIQAARDGRVTYGRGLVDLRRYNRLSPEARLDLRVVGGGWLHGDPLPLQRRFSVTGPGALPGFDFRRPVSPTTDAGQCTIGALPAPGVPALCERFAMAQAELRGDLRFGFFDHDDEDDDRRRRWWGGDIDLDGSWVVFADAGRGWLVGERGGDLTYPRGSLPQLGSFLTDVGVGLDFGDRGWGDPGSIGVYLAKSVSRPSQPVNFFVRVRRRF